MEKSQVKAVLDTNVLISGIVFSGIPRQVMNLVSQKKVSGVTSPALSTELIEVLSKKFPFTRGDLELVKKRLKKEYDWVDPSITIGASRDSVDNRVLEAAMAGRCGYIITGDSHLLDLKAYQNIQILTPAQFLAKFNV